MTDAKNTVLFTLKGENAQLKKIIQETINDMVKVHDKAKELNRNVSISPKADLSQINAVLGKLKEVSDAFKLLEKTSKVNIKFDSLKELSKLGADLKGLNLKGFQNIPALNKKLIDFIFNLEKLIKIGKQIDINIKGLDSLNEAVKTIKELINQVKNLDKEAKKVKKSFDKDNSSQTFLMKANEEAENFNGNILKSVVAGNLLASTLKKVFSEIASAIATAGEEAFKFEQRVYQMRTVTQEQLGNFSQTASVVLGASQDIKANATEAAEGIKTVYAAGVNSATEAVKGYQIAQMSAIATQAEMNDLINFGVIANNNYGTSIDDWPTLFNKISVAAVSSKLDIADFAKQGASIATTFGQAGLSLDESLAFVSAFGNGLRNASDATVAANNMLGKFMNNAKHANDLLQKINKDTKGLGKDVRFSASGVKGIDGTLEGFLKNFRLKLEAYAQKHGMDVQDLIAKMFVDKRAGKGVQQAYKTLFLGGFDEIKKNIKNDTDWMERAYQEAQKSILQKWENLTNSIGGRFKELFVRFQPEIHEILAFIEESINQVINYLSELSRDLGILTEDGKLSESFKSMAKGFGILVKNIIINIGDLIRTISSIVTVIIRFVDTVSYSISSLATILGDSANIWEIAKQQGMKGIREYFKGQMELWEEKSNAFWDAVVRAKNNIEKNFENPINFTLDPSNKGDTTVSSKSRKSPGKAKDKDYIPPSFLASYGDNQIEDIKAKEKFKDDLEKIKEDILKNSSDTFTNETRLIKKEFEQRKKDLNELLDDKKLSEVEYNEALEIYQKDFNTKMLKAQKENLERIQKAREEANRKYVKDINDNYNKKLDTLNKELNDVEAKATEEGKTKAQTLKDTNQVLLKIAQEYQAKAKKFSSGSLDNTEALKKASEIYEKIEKNKSVIYKESLKERLEGSEKSYRKQLETIELNGKLQNLSEDKILNNTIALNKSRVKQIEDTLKSEVKLTQEQREKLIAEQTKLNNEIKLGNKKRSDDAIKNELDEKERQLEIKRNQNQVNLNLNKISNQEYLDNLIQENEEEIKLLQEKNERIVHDAKEKAENLKRIKELETENEQTEYQKQFQMIDDFRSRVNEIANIGAIMSEFSNEVVRGLGEVVSGLGAVGNKIADMGEKALRGDTFGLIVSGITEIVSSVGNAIDVWEAYNEALKDVNTTSQDLSEIVLKNLKSFPLLGDVLYSITKQIYQATGVIKSDKQKQQEKDFSNQVKEIIEKTDKILKDWYEKDKSEKEKAEKERLEAAEKYSDKVKSAYEKEMDMVDKLYTAEEKRHQQKLKNLDEEIDQQKKSIKEIEETFNKNRAEDLSTRQKQGSDFSKALSNKKGSLSASFYRANTLDAFSNTKSGFSSRDAQLEQGLINGLEIEKYRSGKAELALEKYAYFQKQLEDTLDPEERLEIQEKLNSFQKEYYDFAYDKEREQMEKEKQKAVEKLNDLEKEKNKELDNLRIVQEQKQAMINAINNSYDMGADYYLNSMLTRTQTWTDFARSQVKMIASDIDEMKRDLLTARDEALKVRSGSGGGGGSINQNPVPVPGNVSSLGQKMGSMLGNAVSTPSSIGQKVGSLLGKVVTGNNPAPGSSNVIDPDIQKANVIRDIARNNPGFGEQYFFDKYFSFPLETIQDVAKQQNIKGYEIGTPRVLNTDLYMLHQDEAVLNKYDADKYRRGQLNNNSMILNVNFSNYITGVKLDNAKDIQNAVNGLKSDITKELKNEVYRR